MTTRLNVNVNDDTAEALRKLAEEDGTTVTEIVRRAVSVYKFFDDARDQGKTIQLVGEDERITAVQMV
ncbi:MAG: ribbon-helix-helix protein, CopG family [Ornithinimicrobium sp.]